MDKNDAVSIKKIIIGIVVLIVGFVQTFGIIALGVMYLPHINAWDASYPSKLWFLIFTGSSRYGDGADGLGLGIFFIAGILLEAVGFIILIKEYKKQ